jgi:flagellar motility protein MotE (MotC chaperone)
MATLLRVEQDWRGSDRKVDGFALKLAETERLMQETKNAMEAAQIRIGKMEGALKVAQERELKANMTAKRMVKMFTTMSPDQAAKILDELPNSEAADLLARMKEAEAAAILVMFPPKRAAALSARLGGKRGGPP